MSELLKQIAQEEKARRQVLKEKLAPMQSVYGAMRWRDARIEEVAWQLELAAICDEIVTSAIQGTGTRRLISAPPRHGKSETTGRAMPISAYARAKKPLSILYVTSTGDRAKEVSSRVRSAIERLYLLTGDVRFKPGRIWTDTEWETEYGHSWVGMGWSGATGGIGCHLLIMDDVIGTSQVYRSKSTRLAIRRVIQEDLLSRVMDGGAVLQMETRRGKDDTTEWLQREYPTTWISHVWRCHIEERGYLWPDKYGEEWRKSMPHLTDTSPIWRALYQQEPVAEGGTLLAPEWLVHMLPQHMSPEQSKKAYKRVVIGADLAASGKKTGDDTAIVVVGVFGEYRDVLDVFKGKVPFLEQKHMLKLMADKWSATDVIVELAAGGHAMVDTLKAEIRGVRGESPKGDKVTRLTPHLGRFASGQVRVNPGCAWYTDWREEMESFTGLDGEQDNQLDATVWALFGADNTLAAVPRADFMAGFRQAFGR